MTFHNFIPIIIMSVRSTNEALLKEVTRQGRPQTRLSYAVVGGARVEYPVWDDCLLCTKGYYEENHLRIHYKRMHGLDFGGAPLPRTDLELTSFTPFDGKIKNLHCTLCGLECGDEDDLTDHKAEVHVPNSFKGHKCPMCGKRFTMSRNLSKHLGDCQEKENKEPEQQDDDDDEVEKSPPKKKAKRSLIY